jgi:hypothetical protein
VPEVSTVDPHQQPPETQSAGKTAGAAPKHSMSIPGTRQHPDQTVSQQKTRRIAPAGLFDRETSLSGD